MGCTHCDHCELYTQFALNPALQVWKVHYCQGEYNRCVRFQMSLRKEVVPLNLLPNGTRVELPRNDNDYNTTALFNAILKLRIPLLTSLLKSGINVNIRNSDGMTPLMAAASTGNLEIIRLLLSKGADTSITNSLGETAAAIAVRSNHPQAVDLLMSARNLASTEPAVRSGWISRLMGTR